MPQKILTLFSLFVLNLVSAQVYINEIDCDQASVDTKEFIELKSTTANFALDGYVLVFYNAGSTSPYSGSLSYHSIDLDGFTTDVNGIFLVGNSQVVPAPSIIITDGIVQNGPDVVALYLGNDFNYPIGTSATNTNLIDAVAYATNTTQPTNLMSILGISQCINENLNGSKDTQSCQRKNDGTWEVKNPTPAINNDGSGILFNYLSFSVPQSSYNEGDSFQITFSTSQPVSGTDLVFTFTLVNGNFMVVDYNSVNQTVSIPVGQNSALVTVNITDDTADEGDEEMKIQVQPLPMQYVINNNNLIIRVYDNDFIIKTFGKPTTPTFGVVASTAPVNYYSSLEGLSGNTLKQALQDIIANPSEVRLHSYADIWEIISTSDQNPENSNQVWCIYTEVPMAKIDQQQSSSIVGKWNREHIFCQSRGGFEVANGDTADGINFWSSTSASATVNGVSDAHHIRAVNGQENSSRNNKNYGTINLPTVYAGPTGTQGSWRGDVARSLFYMAVRFNGLNVVNGDPSEYLPSTSNPSGNIGDLATLLTWNTSDRSDDYEMNRNNYIYTWQLNRNPFIDYPNLADYIFGSNFGQPWSSTLTNSSFESSKILVYPNPTVDYIIISGVENNSKAEIFSITGKKVLETEFNNEIRIPLDLTSGIYFVKISSNNNSVTKKIAIK